MRNISFKLTTQQVRDHICVMFNAKAGGWDDGRIVTGMQVVDSPTRGQIRDLCSALRLDTTR